MLQKQKIVLFISSIIFLLLSGICFVLELWVIPLFICVIGIIYYFIFIHKNHNKHNIIYKSLLGFWIIVITVSIVTYSITRYNSYIEDKKTLKASMELEQYNKRKQSFFGGYYFMYKNINAELNTCYEKYIDLVVTNSGINKEDWNNGCTYLYKEIDKAYTNGYMSHKGFGNTDGCEYTTYKENVCAVNTARRMGCYQEERERMCNLGDENACKRASKGGRYKDRGDGWGCVNDKYKLQKDDISKIDKLVIGLYPEAK